jgi:hypothetical protein
LIRRGQAVVELALGLLVLTPLLLFGLYLIEAANEKVIATSMATEALWDATAWSQHTYAGPSFHTNSASANAQAAANGRFKPKSRLFLSEKSAVVSCSGSGTGVPFPVASTSSFYVDNGGAGCSARLTIEARFLPDALLDEQGGGFFQAQVSQIRRSFTFCETDSCSGFKLLMDDWGLTADDNEAAECPVTMELLGGCVNKGYFLAGKTVYEAHRTGGGTRSNADRIFVEKIVKGLPADLDKTKEFQMSFRGSPSFTETVPVIEGRDDWQTTPFVQGWQDSYAARKEDFLGR